MTEKEEYLFSGTGFIKNRKPYNDYDAKKWFEEAFFWKKEIMEKLYLYMRSFLKDDLTLSL